jgi:ADP-ribose pyrophosphatase YjhB (NUDIX family)
MSSIDEKNEKITYHTCNNGNECCNYIITPYVGNDSYMRPKTKIKKAGGFVYDREKNKILLVQSRGQLWGPPKGTMQDNEIPIDCAIREIKEETGVSVNENIFKGHAVIKSKAVYYYIEASSDEKEWQVGPQNHIENNDANGIGWFTIDCLNELIRSKKISINQHCRLLIKRVFNKDIIFSYFNSNLEIETIEK